MNKWLGIALLLLIAPHSSAAERYTLIIQYNGTSRSIETADLIACKAQAATEAIKQPGALVFCFPSNSSLTQR